LINPNNRVLSLLKLSIVLRSKQPFGSAASQITKGFRFYSRLSRFLVHIMLCIPVVT